MRQMYFRGSDLTKIMQDGAEAKRRTAVLTQLLEEDEKKNRDFDINAERLSMNKAGQLIVVPTGNGKNLLKKISSEGNRVFEPTRWAAQQLLNFFDVPRKYSGLLHDTDKELLAYNFNRRKAELFKNGDMDSSTYFFLRTVLEDGQYNLRAAFSSQYTPFNNIELHYILSDLASSMHAVVQSWHVDEGIFHARYIVPEMSFKIKNGNKEDVYFMLYNAWNSEIGKSSVWMDCGSFRLVCTNGMMKKESEGDVYRQIHKGGSSILYRMDMENYLKQQHKSMEQHKMMLQDSVKFAIADVPAEIAKIQKRYDLRDKDVKAMQEAFKIEPYNSAYGLINAVTRGAQAETNPEVRNEIESKAGIILFDLVS